MKNNANSEILAEKWLNAFGKNVPLKNLNRYVKGENNYLWHIFSYDFVKCYTGAEVLKMFERMSDSYFVFTQDGCTLETITENEACRYTDVYFTAESYKWTFVKTHESECGPYFCFSEVDNGN